jgi:S1-C subfamily serine protease
MKTFLVTILLMVAFAGCATYSQLFVNADGQVMRCSATGQGVIGMAVASNATDKCSEDMKRMGYIEIEKAGAIGITFSQVTPDTLARIIRIQPGSPAQRGGLHVGDIIRLVDNQIVYSSKDAKLMMFGRANTRVYLRVQRADSTMPFDIVRMQYTRVYGTGDDDVADDGPPAKKYGF